MINKLISRRRFCEGSMTTSLALAVELGVNPLRLATLAVPGSAGLSLQVTGDAGIGYGVALVYNGQPVAHHNHGGEFSAEFQNEDRSVMDRVQDWKGISWKGDATRVMLEGESKLANLNTTLFVQVEYTVVKLNVVRKNIRLRQSDEFQLFYQVTNRLEPQETPAKLWSFDRLDWQGGSVHEYFPAAGFRTQTGLCLGLLTDSGYRNQWTRLIRRDGRPVKPAAQRVPDANLYSGAGTEERSQGNWFVQQTFGEITAQRGGNSESIALPEVSSWKKQGDTAAAERDGVIVISAKSSDDGVLIPLPPFGSEICSLRMEYRSAGPVSLQLWDVDDQLRKVNDLTLYNDGLPASPDSWSEFQNEVFVPGLQGYSKALFLSLAPSEQATKLDAPGGAAKIEIRGLQVRAVATHREPYHRLQMDVPAVKTMFVFADENVPDTVRGHRLASQRYLAEGLNFQGGDTEKVLYADLMMLTWIAGPETFRPMLAPSIWYSAAGEMYLRDSFFALNGVHNRELNEGVFNLWAENQGEDGSINTLVEPNLANLERKSNDSTPLWLMWALLNRRRFGTQLPMEKLHKAANYCLETYDPQKDGTCHAGFVLGQLDVIRYPEGTSVICENQGVLAVTLRTIKELQVPAVSERISEAQVRRAEELYRSYYDPDRKFMRPAREINDAIGLAEIFPEYLSLWLFQRKILTDEMVLSHLDRIPAMMPRKECPHPEVGGTVRPILIGLREKEPGWRYFTETWHPMISDSFASSYANHGMDGIYYNGGSWMRMEVCAYVTGMLHGWKPARKAIENRLWAEINIDPDFPTSQEYLATDSGHPYFGYHRVFAWNSFVLQALEQAGLRKPEMDPDYLRK